MVRVRGSSQPPVYNKSFICGIQQICRHPPLPVHRKTDATDKHKMKVIPKKLEYSMFNFYGSISLRCNGFPSDS